MHATGNKRTGGKTWLEKGTLPGMRDTLLAETGGRRSFKASHLDGAVCTKCALRKAGDVV